MCTPQRLLQWSCSLAVLQLHFFISVRESCSVSSCTVHWSDERDGICCPFDRHCNKDDRTTIKLRRPSSRPHKTSSELVLVQVRTQPEQCFAHRKATKVIAETLAMTLPLPIWHTLKVATCFGFLSSCDASPSSMHPPCH